MALIFNSWLLDGLSVFLTLFALLYWFVTRHFNYWEKRGVPAVRPTPFFGSIADILLLRESIACWLAKHYYKYSGEKFFGVYFLHRPAFIIRDLDLVKNVLVKDAQYFRDRLFAAEEDVNPILAKNLFGLKGSKWRHLRVKLTPTFTSGKMKKMFYIVDECGKMLASCIENSISSGEKNLNVKDMMSRFSTDTIASCAFGVDTHAQSDPKCEFRAKLKRVFDRNSTLERFAANFTNILPELLHLFKMKAIEPEIEAYFRKMYWDVVEERKRTGNTRNDFMDLMIKVMDEGEVKADDANELKEIHEDRSKSGLGHSKTDTTGFEMKDDDFVAQAFVFLLAGFETSSGVLAYTLYELAHSPDVQDKLRSEITTTINKNDGKLTYEAMTSMPYLDMVLSETLRKYPTVPFLERVCLSDYKIPGTEVTIEKGTQVLVPALGIHNDPEIYPEPDKYNPDRFNVENKSKRSPYAHLPFGEGPRICIGMRFGQMQVKTALVHTLTSFQFRPCAETPRPPLTYKAGAFTHVPKKDIILAFNKVA